MIINIVKFIALAVVTFFFMEILTDKNKKISVVGTILVCCSSVIAYRGVVNAILYGEALIIILNFLINSKNTVLKNIALILAGVFAAFYRPHNYRQWYGVEQILLFVYIAIAIWIVLKNRRNLKINFKGILKLLPGLLIGIVLLGMIEYYNGINYRDIVQITEANDVTKSNGLMQLFSYGYSMFLPFVKTDSNVVYSSFLSIFPLSLILAMVYVYKKEKHLEFLMPMIIVIVFESIYCMTGISILEKILFLHNNYMEIAASAIGLACIYLYVYMIANIDENVFSLKASIRVVLALLVLFFLMPKPEIFTSKSYLYILTMCLTILYFLFINFADKRYQKVLLIVLTLWSLISFAPVIIMAI